jgi:hypothetical protein
MATRFYLRNTAQTPNITPSADADWEDTSALVRAWARTTKSNDTITTVNFTDANATNRDILFSQYVSLPLTPGQTITGAQAVQFVVRASEVNAGNNLFTALGLRVIASDGTTVRKTVLAVTRDGTETTTTLTNRNLTATSAAGNYTTVAGDYLVIEIGYGGDPTGSNTHSGALSLGDSAGSDLTANDTGTTAGNPWVEIADNLTFQEFIATGGATAGGEAVTSKEGAAQEFTYTGSGGATAGGAATTTGARDYLYSASGGATAGGAATTALGTGTLTLTLKQGASTIATWSQRLTHTITDYTFTVTSAELATISYPATNLTIEVAGATGANALLVYEVVLEAPAFSPGATNDYPYTGSGGATAGGAATTEVAHAFAYTGSGGATAGGEGATEYRSSARGEYVGSGGGTAGGAAVTAVTHEFTYSATGGGTSGGAAETEYVEAGLNSYSYSGSGGGTAGGAATTTVTHEFSYAATGGGTAGGAATTAVTHDFAYVATGGATAGGAATTAIAREYVYAASGGGAAGGTATTSVAHSFTYTATGGGTAGGTATTAVAHAFTYIATGGATAGGAATTVKEGAAQEYAYTGSGGATAGGTATTSASSLGFPGTVTTATAQVGSVTVVLTAGTAVATTQQIGTVEVSLA